jgi:1-acyl-sn-glycerol-3-phosphate acyltransferase
LSSRGRRAFPCYHIPRTMLHFLPAPLLGIFSILLYLVNAAFWCSLIYIVSLARIVVPIPAWRRFCWWLSWRMAEGWVVGDNGVIWLTQKIDWDIGPLPATDPAGTYLVIANHQSWVDILILFRLFHRRIPFLRFFLKRQLLWVPFIGIGCWFLGFPFMARYSKQRLLERPELAGRDRQLARRVAQRFRDQPYALLNFLEGTRFTAEKHRDQASPYRHLLLPKAGGTAIALSALRGRLTGLLDVTLVYPGGAVGFWGFLCGRLRRAVVRVRELPVPADLPAGDYENDPEFRQRFQEWVRQIWEEKDAELERLLAGYQPLQHPQEDASAVSTLAKIPA